MGVLTQFAPLPTMFCAQSCLFDFFFSLFDCFSLCLFVLLLGTFAISNGGSFREKLECVVEVYDGRACSICSYCYCLPLPGPKWLPMSACLYLKKTS